MPPALKEPLIDRLWKQSEIDPVSGCWVWKGNIRAKGYAAITTVPGRQEKVHVASWKHFHGDIPDGLELDHLCHTNSDCDLADLCPHRACWNPAHLEPVPHATNVLRGQSPAAKAARQTHCKHGHEFSGSNLILGPKGRRSCRECRRRIERTRRKIRRPLTETLAVAAVVTGGEQLPLSGWQRVEAVRAMHALGWHTERIQSALCIDHRWHLLRITRRLGIALAETDQPDPLAVRTGVHTIPQRDQLSTRPLPVAA